MGKQKQPESRKKSKEQQIVKELSKNVKKKH